MWGIIKENELWNEKEENKYQGQLTIYNRAVQDYERDKKILLAPGKVQEFRENLIKKELQVTISHDGINSIGKPGYCEPLFKRELIKYFSAEKIKTKLTLAIPDYQYPYSPDFAYIDTSLGLHINIEIDEPYAFKTKKPTHYLSAEKDERRNIFFLSKGWIVIRFAEEQVARYPDSCCKLIAEIIHNFIENKAIILQFSNVVDLPVVIQWTEDEAWEMAAKGDRDRYTAPCRNCHSN